MQPITPRIVGASVIVVGATEVTPSASHLFALLLALSLSPRGAWTRRSLQELLFGRADERTGAHRLRQLLYRLRGFGLTLDEDASGVISVRNAVVDPLADAVSADPSRAGDGTILPLYAPRLPETFLDWLDEQRASLARRLGTVRASALRAARERQEWPVVLRLALSLRAIDVHDEEWSQAAAEAQAMLGRRDEALATIDHFVRESDAELAAWPSLKRLRARITTTRVPRREGTLRGREECLAFLADQWELACAGGGGRACVILGAAGMGKTRVGEAFAASVRLGGAQVTHHRCDNQSRQIPLSLFTRLVPELRQRRGSIGADPALASALNRIAPNGTTPIEDLGSIEDRREELKCAIVDLVDAVSSEQPLLIVVDDAHLLDDASRAAIHTMVDRMNEARVLVLLLCRPRPEGHGRLFTASRIASCVLPPLSPENSRALFIELVPASASSESAVSWAIAQAAGNPFYLNALAQSPSASVALSTHLRSLAMSCYLGLTPAARTVLEASLLLDTFATSARVSKVAAVDENVFLDALRELEDSDMLRCEGGLFIGPHAIMREALDALIPSACRAVLHRRIAVMLTSEPHLSTDFPAVGWAAMESWLAAGDATSAVDLALRLARNAAALGEPEAGALLLEQLCQHSLPVGAQRETLDTLIGLADAGNCSRLLSQAVKRRTALAVATNEGRSEVAALVLRSVTVDNIATRAFDIAALERVIADPLVATHLRVAALARIIAIADLYFDRCLAQAAYDRLAVLVDSQLVPEPLKLRAFLIYHSTFGDSHKALDLIQQLATIFPEPSMEVECRTSRNYCMLGLLKIGRYQDCVRFAWSEWDYMNAHGHLFAAEYAGAVAVEAHIDLGASEPAENMLTRMSEARRRRPLAEALHSPVYYSSVVLAALHRRDFEVAEEHLPYLAATSDDLAVIPRLRMVQLALSIRLRQLRGSPAVSDCDIDELLARYDGAASLGSLDMAVEVLWHAFSARGERALASSILTEYLMNRRREVDMPEASLRLSTASDPAWAQYSGDALSARARGSRLQ